MKEGVAERCRGELGELGGVVWMKKMFCYPLTLLLGVLKIMLLLQYVSGVYEI